MNSATILVALISLAVPILAAPEYASMGPDIFDSKAKAEALINRATVQATREDKRILLLFGANWCPWCRRLHRALTAVPTVRDRLRGKFVLVFVDANTRNNKHRNAAVIEKCGNPVRDGIPVFVVLDRDGKQLSTRETESFAAGTDAAVAARVLRFLDEWMK